MTRTSETTSDGERLREADPATFASLVREYTPRLLGVARRLTGDHSTADDLVQETWIAAYRNRASFADGSLLAWLIVILRRAFLQQQRSSERRGAREQQYACDDQTQQNSCVSDTKHDTAGLFAALDQLSSRQRDVVVERIMAERSTADTARLLGIAEGTVKATLSQALHRLRHLLNATDELS